MKNPFSEKDFSGSRYIRELKQPSDTQQTAFEYFSYHSIAFLSLFFHPVAYNNPNILIDAILHITTVSLFLKSPMFFIVIMPFNKLIIIKSRFRSHNMWVVLMPHQTAALRNNQAPLSKDHWHFFTALLHNFWVIRSVWTNSSAYTILDNITVDFYLSLPKQCCCWVYIHHRGPLHSNNIVKEKGVSVPRNPTIQCPRLSEFFWKKMRRLKGCYSHLLFWFLSWCTWN